MRGFLLFLLAGSCLTAAPPQRGKISISGASFHKAVPLDSVSAGIEEPATEYSRADAEGVGADLSEETTIPLQQ